VILQFKKVIPLLALTTLGILQSSCTSALKNRNPSSVENPEVNSTSQNARPNVIIIYTDDLGYSDISFSSQMKSPTPNLLKLAERGITYRNFYSASSICSPARASFLTGKFPPHTGVQKAHLPGHPNHELKSNERTLGEIFQSANYKTGFFGKWHVGDKQGVRPLDQGFDSYTGILHSHDLTRTLWKQEKVYKEKAETLEIVDEILNDSLRFIENYKSQSFFFTYATPLPHVPLPSGYSYIETLFRIDQDLGKIIDKLKALGLFDNTLIVFASDNGPWIPKGSDAGESWPHRGTKGSTLEGGFKVPLLVSWPQIHKDSLINDQIISGTDVFATLADLIGVDVPSEIRVSSQSFLKSIKLEDQQRVRLSFPYFHMGTLEAVRLLNFKYDFENKKLYNLAIDPTELVDVSKAYPAIVSVFQNGKRNVDTETLEFWDNISRAQPMRPLLTSDAAADTIENNSQKYQRKKTAQNSIYFSALGSHHSSEHENIAYTLRADESIAPYLNNGLDVNQVFKRFSRAAGLTGLSGNFDATLVSLWALSGQVEKIRELVKLQVPLKLKTHIRPVKHSKNAPLKKHLESEIEIWESFAKQSDSEEKRYFENHVERLKEIQRLLEF